MTININLVITLAKTLSVGRLDIIVVPAVDWTPVIRSSSKLLGVRGDSSSDKTGGRGVGGRGKALSRLSLTKCWSTERTSAVSSRESSWTEGENQGFADVGETDRALTHEDVLSGVPDSSDAKEIKHIWQWPTTSALITLFFLISKMNYLLWTKLVLCN